MNNCRKLFQRSKNTFKSCYCHVMYVAELSTAKFGSKISRIWIGKFRFWTGGWKFSNLSDQLNQVPNLPLFLRMSSRMSEVDFLLSPGRISTNMRPSFRRLSSLLKTWQDGEKLMVICNIVDLTVSLIK